MKREWQYKFTHAKQSLVDTTQGLTSTAGSVAHGTKDAVHDLSEKSQELANKTERVLKDAKNKTVEVASGLKEKTVEAASDLKDKTMNVANDLKDKGEDVAKQVKTKSKKLEHNVEDAKDQAKEQVKGKANQAKQWWDNTEIKKDVERSAKDVKRSARDTGERAHEWVQNADEETRDWLQDKSNAFRSGADQYGFDKEDVEHNFGRYKSSWDTARDEARDGGFRAPRAYQNRDDISDDLENRGRAFWGPRAYQHRDDFSEDRDQHRGADQMRDSSRNRSQELRGRLEGMKDRGQDWAQDRRREFRKWGRQVEDQADRSGRDFKRRAQDLRDAGEDRFKDAKRELRNKGEEMEDYGRRHLRKSGWNADDTRSRHTTDRGVTAANGSDAVRGYGRPSEEDGGRRSRFDEHEEYVDRGGRRSVTEAAKEGKGWWPQHHHETDERRDGSRPSSTKAPWWKAGSTSGDQALDQFGEAKDHARRGMGHLKDSLTEKAQSGRSWASDKTDDLKDRYEYGKQQAERELHDKFSRDRGYHHEQGRDFGERPHQEPAVHSDDNWFHLDRGESNRASRGRERGM